MKHSLLSAAIALALTAQTTLAQPAVPAPVPPSTPGGPVTIQPIGGIFKDPSKPIEDRINDMIAQMTPEEKDALIHGSTRFSTAAIPEFGLLERWLSDGPHGVRRDRVYPVPMEDMSDAATAFACGMAVAATWDPDLIYLEGHAVGQEALVRNKAVMLAPGVNILRTPINGRTFEYLGEDPFLSGRMAVGYIKGVQSEDVAATVKHFALNNQETNRNNINAVVDERTLREIYLPAFEAAVKEGKVLNVMTAYNKFRGFWCSENDYLINTILKGEWNFQGVVMSDWGGVHSTDGAVRAGLDLEMDSQKIPTYATPTPLAFADFYMARPFLEGIKNGTYPMSLLDDKARRNLRVMISTHLLDPGLRKTGSILTPEHLDIARQIAEQGMVLLKNQDNALPLDATKINKIVIIGENAIHIQAPGGLSSGMKTPDETTPLAGIVNYLSNNNYRGSFTFSLGYNAPSSGEGPISIGAGGAAAITGVAGTRDSKVLAAEAIAAAKDADMVLFIGGLNKTLDTESRDRPDMKLPYGQDDLLQQIVAANPHTIVVLVGGSPVEMGPWLDKVPALLYAWYGGTKAGDAVARVLFGDVNPSGKLPATFPKQLADVPANVLNAYVTTQDGTEEYKEGIFVGYRWYDSKKEAAQPLFPFGFGLSYTTFAYSNPRLVPGADGTLVNVQFDVQNTGKRDGAEIAELYVKDMQHGPTDAVIPRPDKELKGFKKVFLKPGEKQTVTIPLNQRSFAYFHVDADATKQGWVAETGDYKIEIGASSRDLKLDSTFHLAQTLFQK